MIKYILIINIITFLIYGVDKYLAYKEKNRISEKFLRKFDTCKIKKHTLNIGNA